MISLTDVLFPVLLQCVAGEAGEDQPHDEATPSHFDLQGNAWINYNTFENIQKPQQFSNPCDCLTVRTIKYVYAQPTFWMANTY